MASLVGMAYWPSVVEMPLFQYRLISYRMRGCPDGKTCSIIDWIGGRLRICL